MYLLGFDIHPALSTPADIKLTDGCGTTHELLGEAEGKAAQTGRLQ